MTLLVLRTADFRLVLASVVARQKYVYIARVGRWPGVEIQGGRMFLFNFISIVKG